ERVLNWHLLEDVLGWLAVLVVAVVMKFVQLPVLDPLLSIGFTLFILVNVVRNLWQTGRLFFQATPDVQALESIRQSLLAIENVNGIHHLHLWSLDGEQHVLTAHVRASSLVTIAEYAKLKTAINKALESQDLAHTTIEIE